MRRIKFTYVGLDKILLKFDVNQFIKSYFIIFLNETHKYFYSGYSKANQKEEVEGQSHLI